MSWSGNASLIRLEWGLVTWALIPTETGESHVLDFMDPINFFSRSFFPSRHVCWQILVIQNATMDILSQALAITGDSSLGVGLPIGSCS
jgi:hypothetical protein